MAPSKPKDESEQPRPETAREGIDWTDFGTAAASIWRLHRRKLYLVLALLAVRSLASRAFIEVPTGSKAIVMVFGKVSHVADSGLNFVWPVVSTVRIVPIRIQTVAIKADAVSQDQQKVFVEATVQWSFKPDSIGETFASVGAEDSVTTALMLPAINEALKAVTAKHVVGVILDKREEIKSDIDVKFRSKMTAYKLNIIDVLLTNLHFDPDYEKAIEDKQVAEVGVKTAANVADATRKRAQGDADAAVIKARGEAQSKRMLASTLSQANLQLEWIKAWQAGGSQVPQFISGGNGGSFIMDMSKLKGAPTPKRSADDDKTVDTQVGGNTGGGGGSGDVVGGAGGGGAVEGGGGGNGSSN